MENFHSESTADLEAQARVRTIRRRDAASTRVPHTRRPAISSRHTLHLTLHTREEVESLREQKIFRALESALYRGAERFGFRLVHFSVREDEIHLIGEADNAHSLSRGMQGLEVRMAKAVNRATGHSGSVFADRYRAAIVRTQNALRALINFVLPNFRWDFCDLELDPPDPLSSATAPLVVPRSWLLRAEPG